MLPTTPHQVAMKSALDTFLSNDLINIIDSYFAFSNAVEVLILGSDGKPVDSESNRTTTDAIRLALTSPQCDRDIIRLIFENAADHGYTDFLNILLNDLRFNQKKIILDNVDFSGLNLTNLNFDSASMQNANFTGASLDSASFVASDLTGARGLIVATGHITVNCQTVLADTGLYDNPRKLNAFLNNKPCLIVLSGSRQKLNYVGLTLSDTLFLIRFSDVVE